MTAFWTGFWSWASEHWFLAFILLFCVLCVFDTAFKALGGRYWKGKED